jgi:N6-adenosine-specific RNA methylase IME4
LQKYKIALLDPPYLYDNLQQLDKKRGGIQYPMLSLPELCALPIYKAMEDDSIIVVWATFPKICDTYEGKYNVMEMIRAWKYKPVTALFVWIKTNKKGQAIYEETNLEEYDSYYSGLGRYSNSNAEIAIVARRGKGLERKAKNVKQLIFAPIGNHSEKPREQYNRLDKLYGDVPRIEFFARKQNEPPNGWNATGLDFDGVDIRDFLKGYE